MEVRMDIRRLGPGDDGIVLAAADLFDTPPRPEWTRRFLTEPGHHLLLAEVEGAGAGFVTGVEMTHPDKGTEMFLYELGVHERHRGRGIGRALVGALAELARERGCYGMWVLTDHDNDAALATYRAGGGGSAEPTVMLTWAWPAGS
jgi:ribosomal protein S18 acetylase RimI-like enzyme